MKKISFPWFGRTGVVIYPISLPGLIITLAALVYVIYSFIEIDSRSHSVSDTLRPFVIRCIILYVIYAFLAVITGALGKKE